MGVAEDMGGSGLMPGWVWLKTWVSAGDGPKKKSALNNKNLEQ